MKLRQDRTALVSVERLVVWVVALLLVGGVAWVTI